MQKEEQIRMARNKSLEMAIMVDEARGIALLLLRCCSMLLFGEWSSVAWVYIVTVYWYEHKYEIRCLYDVFGGKGNLRCREGETVIIGVYI
jgi:hypothetical protein